MPPRYLKLHVSVSVLDIFLSKPAEKTTDRNGS